MLMLQCKAVVKSLPDLYVPEGSTEDFKTNAINASTTHTCSRKHTNEYIRADFMDWS